MNSELKWCFRNTKIDRQTLTYDDLHPQRVTVTVPVKAAVTQVTTKPTVATSKTPSLAMQLKRKLEGHNAA